MQTKQISNQVTDTSRLKAIKNPEVYFDMCIPASVDYTGEEKTQETNDKDGIVPDAVEFIGVEITMQCTNEEKIQVISHFEAGQNDKHGTHDKVIKASDFVSSMRVQHEEKIYFIDLIVILEKKIHILKQLHRTLLQQSIQHAMSELDLGPELEGLVKRGQKIINIRAEQSEDFIEIVSSLRNLHSAESLCIAASQQELHHLCRHVITLYATSCGEVHAECNRELEFRNVICVWFFVIHTGKALLYILNIEYKLYLYSYTCTYSKAVFYWIFEYSIQYLYLFN